MCLVLIVVICYTQSVSIQDARSVDTQLNGGKIIEVEKNPTEWYGKEDDFRDKLAEWLEDREIRQTGQQTDSFEWARITSIKVNEKHPTREDYPDIQVEHSGFNLGWRKLSNPLLVECKNGRNFQEDLLQLLRYKYDDGKELGLEKIGQYHVGYTSPKTVFERNPFENSDFYSYPQFERTLWHLGLGLLKKGYDEGEFLLTFNEREQAVIR